MTTCISLGPAAVRVTLKDVLGNDVDESKVYSLKRKKLLATGRGTGDKCTGKGRWAYLNHIEGKRILPTDKSIRDENDPNSFNVDTSGSESEYSDSE